jgi:hypothetical protein
MIVIATAFLTNGGQSVIVCLILALTLIPLLAQRCDPHCPQGQ